MASTIAGSASLLHKAIAFLSSRSSREIHLKKEQDIAIKSLLKEKDVLAVLPTGFGKSLVFQVFAVVRSLLYGGRYGQKTRKLNKMPADLIKMYANFINCTQTL